MILQQKLLSIYLVDADLYKTLAVENSALCVLQTI